MKLTEKLNYLRALGRKEIGLKIEEAFTGNSEDENNSSLSVIKMERAFLEQRILDIESLLSESNTESNTTSIGVARIGSMVTLQDINSTSETFTIVRESEANPSAGRISCESLLGNALIGCSSGDVVQVVTPLGPIRYLVIIVN